MASCSTGHQLRRLDTSFRQYLIIRLMTFEKLQLIHTSRTLEMGYFGVFDDTYYVKIQEKESVDLERLSQLMSEFREAFMRFCVPLTSFILGYWKLRMDQVMRGGYLDGRRV